jgi:nicotinate phosphoribosyltransferase
MELDMKMIGTYPHELPMFIAAVNGGPRNANYLTMEDWVKVYDGYLGTALTDSFGSEVFFNNFSKKHACLFDGVRHDSGDPIAFIDMAINRYKELGIDPMTKSIVFSDSLNFEKCVQIKKACEGRIKCMFGIGTNLTCDTGHPSCNIVMKLSSCQINARKPKELCVKLSDVEGKEMGDPEEVAVYRYLLRNQGK